MPTPQPSLSPERAAELIGACFRAPPSPATKVGVEIEWLTYHGATGARPDLATLEAACSVDAAGHGVPGGAVTFEPGGQVELSTPPAEGVEAACGAVAAGATALRARLAAAGVEMAAVGLDPVRTPARITTAERYVAMEAYFDRLGPVGREMMCGTAAVQVNLDLGADGPGRWRAAHAVGPVLAAAFANSPFARGRPTGHRSTRLAIWAALDPARTAPVPAGDPVEDPVADWIRYVLAAPVMLVRDAGTGGFRPGLRPLPFGRWLAGDGGDGYPDEADLAYHLTTLFPPVRPRGWLEVRMIDALPEPWWRVAVAVTTALVTDDRAAAAALEACAGSSEWWPAAAHRALADPLIARAARSCFAAALDALPRIGAGAATQSQCAAYADRFVDRGRCPADDLLDTWASSGALPPPAATGRRSRSGARPLATEETPSWI